MKYAKYSLIVLAAAPMLIAAFCRGGDGPVLPLPSAEGEKEGNSSAAEAKANEGKARTDADLVEQFGKGGLFPLRPVGEYPAKGTLTRAAEKWRLAQQAATLVALAKDQGLLPSPPPDDLKAWREQATQHQKRAKEFARTERTKFAGKVAGADEIFTWLGKSGNESGALVKALAALDETATPLFLAGNYQEFVEALGKVPVERPF